jgi:DNA-binding LacI/PurR family transcriptional regulator
LLPVGADVRSDEALSLDYYMRFASAAAAATFTHEQALLLLPPVLTQEGLRGFAIDGGIIVDPSAHDSRILLFDALGLPVITIERDLDRVDDRWYVATEPAANTSRVLDHLAERGAERIALLLPEVDWGWVAESLDAYRSWVGEHGAPSIVVPVSMHHGEESAFSAVSLLLRRKHPPDAIFILASRFIGGTLRAAKTVGREVPRELLLAAGVDGALAREGDPRVTALDHHPELIAEAAVEMLIARLAGDSVEAPRHIEATLRVRASTGG